jgi:two-component system LytT family response regulator
MLGRMRGVVVAGEAGDAGAALESIRAARPDLVLLDIRMPGLTGLELAASQDGFPPIVFTTAYDQYALEAFEVSAVDYLLKPVEPRRLEAAIEKVRARSALPDADRIRALLEKLERRVGEPEDTRLAARHRGSVRFFDAGDVTRIRASEKYALFEHEQREYVLDESLNALEQRLGPAGFVRVHRSELVNLARVRALHTEDGSTTLELSDGQRVPVSRRFVPELKARLGIV